MFYHFTICRRIFCSPTLIAGLLLLSWVGRARAQGYAFNKDIFTDSRPGVTSPMEVAVDSIGNVFVADNYSGRLYKVGNNGGVIAQSSTQYMYGAKAITVDKSGRVIVSLSAGGSQLVLFDSNCNFLYFSGVDSSDYWTGVAVDSNSNIFISDSGSYFNTNCSIVEASSNTSYLTQFGSTGSGNGQFQNPGGVAVDSNNNVFVADSGNNRIQKFSNSGKYIDQFNYLGNFQSGTLYNPSAIAIDSSNNIFVVDGISHGFINDRIVEFDQNGNYLTQFEGFTNNFYYDTATGVAVDANDNVFVASPYGVIAKFSPFEVRLNVPSLQTIGGVRYLTQKVFVRGGGTQTISGHWVDNGFSGPESGTVKLNLSDGQWYEIATFSEPGTGTAISGNHTLTYMVDTPGSPGSPIPLATTKAEEVFISGFIPSKQFWPESNMDIGFINAILNGLPTEDGLCEGFAQSARLIYKGKLPLPPPAPMPITNEYKVLLERRYWVPYQDAGNEWVHSSGEDKRISDGRQDTGDIYINRLFSEAQLIRYRLLGADPCVIDIFSSDINGEGHALVATASVYAEGIYQETTDSLLNRVQIFSVYDPNAPKADNKFVEAFDAGENNIYPLLQFQPQDKLAAFYAQHKLVMWAENSYPGP